MWILGGTIANIVFGPEEKLIEQKIHVIEPNKSHINSKSCPSCGFCIDKDTNFCPECGTTIENPMK